MLMKWEDLESGDIVMFTSELYLYFKNNFGYWCDLWCNRELTVDEIYLNNDSSLTIIVKETATNAQEIVRILKNGRRAASYFPGFDNEILKIIKLKED